MMQTFKAIQEYGLESLRFPNIKDDEVDFGIYKTAYEYTKRGEELLVVLSTQYRLNIDQQIRNQSNRDNLVSNLKKENKKLKKENEKIVNSLSYRCGRFVTWPLRMVYEKLFRS